MLLLCSTSASPSTHGFGGSSCTKKRHSRSAMNREHFRLRANQVQHVLAGKITGLPEDRLQPVVVISRMIFVMQPVLGKPPAGVRLRRLLDVLLRVVAFAEREEFHHLARKILVWMILVAVRTVQIDEHRRVFRHRD